MRVKAVRESTSKLTKDDIIKSVRLYGLDKGRLENLIMANEPSQYFVIETDLGDINIQVDYEIKKVNLDAPLKIQEELAK
jgi:hypothetical protein